MLAMEASPSVKAEFKRKFIEGDNASAQALLHLKENAAPNLVVYLSEVKGAPAIPYDGSVNFEPAIELATNMLALLHEAYLRYCKQLLFVHPVRRGEPATLRTRCTFIKLHSKDRRKAIVEIDQKYKTAIELEYLAVPKLPTRLEYGNTKDLYAFLAPRVVCGFVNTTLEELAGHLLYRHADGEIVYAVGSDIFTMLQLWGAKIRGGAGWAALNKGTEVQFPLPIPVSRSSTESVLSIACGWDKLRVRCLFTQWVLQSFANEPIDARLAEEDNRVYAGMTDKGPLSGPLWLWREFIESEHVSLGRHPLYGRSARELLFRFGAPHAYVGQ